MKKPTAKNSKWRAALLIALAGLSMVVATILLWPLIQKLATPEGQQALRDWIDSVGLAGWLVVLGIQVLQIVIAFIPGEPVEVLAGILFGAWGGLLLCLVGSALASIIVFAISRRFGIPLLHRLFGKEKVDNFAFLRDSSKVENAAFVLFLLPGVPKDMLTYVAGVSKIKMSRFLLITTFARIPSIITSTIAGGALLDNWPFAVGVFLLTGLIGFVGIRYKERIMRYVRSIGSRKKDRK